MNAISYFQRRYANLVGVGTFDHHFILPNSYVFSTQELMTLLSLAECERRYWHKQDYSKFAVKRYVSCRDAIETIDRALNCKQDSNHGHEFQHLARLSFAQYTDV